MIAKLLTVSAFTLALATSAMAQTSGSDTGSDSGSSGTATDSATTNSTTTTSGTRDDDTCAEKAEAEQTPGTTANTIPDAACED